MKRKIFVGVVIAMMIICSVCAAYASSMQPFANNYTSAKAGLSITNGTAVVTGKLYGVSGIMTKATIHLYLQQYKNGTWVDYADWLETSNGTNSIVSKTTSVPKGYTYRAKASCYAYAGSKSEHVTRYSTEVKY